MIDRAGLPVRLSLSPYRGPFSIPELSVAASLTVLPYVSGFVAFVISDSIEAAVITAIIAGCFQLANTFLTGMIVRKVDRIERRQKRIMEIHGERLSDKSTTDTGQNRPELKLERERRRP